MIKRDDIITVYFEKKYRSQESVSLQFLVFEVLIVMLALINKN